MGQCSGTHTAHPVFTTGSELDLTDGEPEIKPSLQLTNWEAMVILFKKEFFTTTRLGV